MSLNNFKKRIDIIIHCNIFSTGNNINFPNNSSSFFYSNICGTMIFRDAYFSIIFIFQY